MTRAERRANERFIQGQWRRTPPRAPGVYPAVGQDGQYTRLEVGFDAVAGRAILPEQLPLWWWSLPFPPENKPKTKTL